MTFATMQPEFEKLNCKLLGLSIDSTFSHIAWLRTIKEKIEYKGMKNVEVTFPVISDLTMEVSKAFGMLQPGASTTQAVRAVFIIDPKAMVRAILYYPLSNGRNMEEIKRLLIAMQHSDEHKIATPANWQTRRRRDRPAAGLVRRGQGAGGESRGGLPRCWTGSWSSRSARTATINAGSFAVIWLGPWAAGCCRPPRPGSTFRKGVLDDR